MTGFAKKELSENGINVNVELKSLNGRNLEISCKLPRNIIKYEIELREIIRKAIARGTINLFVSFEYDNVGEVKLNHEKASAYFQSLKQLKSKLKIRDAVSLENLLLFSEDFMEKEGIGDESNEIRIVKKGLREAIKILEQGRKREGQNINKDFSIRINNIHNIVEEVESLGIERIPTEREKIRQRIAQLFENDEIDEQRLQMEMVLMADKLDIAEECVRLHSHIKYFHDLLKSKEPVGRKITFLLQEMHREVNTIGSKANDAIISQHVVSLKEEIERIREQAQNIE